MKNLLFLIVAGACVYYFITHGMPKAQSDPVAAKPAPAAANSEPAPAATPHTNFLKSPIDRARAANDQERQRVQESP
jgi:hypothetical protein